jgi:hypothetical protein
MCYGASEADADEPLGKHLCCFPPLAAIAAATLCPLTAVAYGGVCHHVLFGYRLCSVVQWRDTSKTSGQFKMVFFAASFSGPDFEVGLHQSEA